MNILSDSFGQRASQLDNLIGVNNKTISFIKKTMSYHTRLRVEEKIIARGGIGIQCGINQAGS
jgi:methenyltetrahydromethanopterin cyclohydrolase